jgi:hypothetical protein
MVSQQVSDEIVQQAIVSQDQVQQYSDQPEAYNLACLR